MKIKWFTTAAIEIKGKEGSILFDPFVTLKGADIDVGIEAYDGFSDVFITHGHFDHMANIPQMCERNSKIAVYCTKTPYRTLTKKGVSPEKLKTIDFGQTIKVKQMRITVYHAKHAVLPKVTATRFLKAITSSKMSNLPYILRENRKCRENDECAVFHIDDGEKCVTIMGSMNLRDDVSYPKNSDLLILPYNGWEDNYPEAVKVIEKLKPRRVILDHYDSSFPPVTTRVDVEPILRNYDGLVQVIENNVYVDI